MSNIDHGLIRVDRTTTAFCQWAGCLGKKKKIKKDTMTYNIEEDMYFCTNECNTIYISYNWSMIVSRKALAL